MVTSGPHTLIVGRALVSSLGSDTTTCCAAARAGIVRTCDAEHYLAADDEQAAGSPVAVHLAAFARGFEGQVRLQCLMAAALSDLQLQLPDAPWRNATTAVYLSMPAPGREREAAPLISDEQERARFEELWRSVPLPDPQRMAAQLLARACEQAGFEKQLALRFVDTSGSTGVTRAVIEAAEDLRCGQVELALVVGVDSLVEEHTLHWLDRTGRLKTSVRPAGLRTGEACSILVLESRQRASQRRARALAGIALTAYQHEPSGIFSGKVAIGAALAHTIDQLRGSANWDERSPFISLDLNGENARALEWGNALTHLVSQCQSYQHVRLELPAIAFGDTGAASAGVAACMTLHAFERGYGPEHCVAIVNASEAGPRSACLLEKYDL
jgi:3-oxoacyl-[acyl-carrier-protein] synthase-1